MRGYELYRLKGICSFEIPKSMDIRSTIFLSNRSSYSIANAKLYVAYNGVETPIASVDSISSQDSLKFDAPTLTSIVGLRGRQLVLRVKAQNSVTSQDTNLSISLDFYEEKHNLVVVLSNRQEGQSHAADVVYDDKPEPVAPKPENQVSAITDSTIILVDIPKRMDLKDKIIIANRSPYMILKAVVALVEDNKLSHIGSATFVAPSASVEIIDYAYNGLYELRGKRLAIKIKGYKKLVNNDPLSMDVSNPIDMNNLDQDALSYDFKVTLAEEKHDLYINVSADENKENMFDF
jgi:hypothetical protein